MVGEGGVLGGHFIILETGKSCFVQEDSGSSQFSICSFLWSLVSVEDPRNQKRVSLASERLYANVMLE